MKLIKSLINSFKFFQNGYRKPLFLVKSALIFYNLNDNNEKNLNDNFWQTNYMRLFVFQNNYFKTKQTQYNTIRYKPDDSKGLLEINRGLYDKKGDFNKIKSMSFKHKIEVCNEIDEFCIDDITTVVSEYEPESWIENSATDSHSTFPFLMKYPV